MDYNFLKELEFNPFERCNVKVLSHLPNASDCLNIGYLHSSSCPRRGSLQMNNLDNGNMRPTSGPNNMHSLGALPQICNTFPNVRISCALPIEYKYAFFLYLKKEKHACTSPFSGWCPCWASSHLVTVLEVRGRTLSYSI